MFENYKKLKRGIMIGIGAESDYLAENTKLAPEWMKNNSLEWLYRIYQKPKRL
jgi:N-acetylglucosaminyldiphosphoundecaprenol N-acetyl-beta-D-mannosaminyltransferase